VFENLLLWQPSTNSGAAIEAVSTATNRPGYIFCYGLRISGDQGWERCVLIDGTLNEGSGARSVYFTNCLFFGATTPEETIVLKRVVNVAFCGCGVFPAPTMITQGIKVLDTFSSFVSFSALSLLGNFRTQAAGGLHAAGVFNGNVTCESGSARNVFDGSISGSSTNSGALSNLKRMVPDSDVVNWTLRQQFSGGIGGR